MSADKANYGTIRSVKKRDARRSLVYRWRYQIGYICLAGLFAFVLVFLSNTTPGGLSTEEVDSAIMSHNFGENVLSESIIDAPFKLLQKASISILGLSLFSVKLPALILAFLSGLGMILLLNRWYKKNVAVLASTLAISTSLFLQMAVTGTPNAMYIFLPIAIMVMGLLIAGKRNPHVAATFGMFATLALALYSPFMIYVIAALAAATIIHPHLRFSIKNMPRPQLMAGLSLFTVLIVPLVVSAIRDINTLTELLAGDGLIGFNFLDRLKEAVLPFVSFNSPQDSATLVPILGLATVALVLLGLTSSYKARYTAKNYILVVWGIFALLAITLEPRSVMILFLPIVVLMASGVEFILDTWYGLFPENPYARVGGLLPISFLVIVSVATSVWHFAYGYYYTPQVARYFSNDITLVNNHIEDGAAILAREESREYEFYKIMENKGRVSVMSEAPKENPPLLIVLRDFENRHDISMSLDRIVTSAKLDDSDRLYIYR